ncbi:hypothetical protein [Streptomyces sp. NPDC059649]|uniref:hypothetical protein n=1 Tax=Streptomyces sp. NPDC059649 TaxID=3346895 RepID=UPI0036C2ACFF
MIQILPIGTPVWVAQAARPDGTRRALCGDGVVSTNVPCDVCLAQQSGPSREMTPAAYAIAAVACEEPVGFVAMVRGLPVTVTPDDNTVIAVPITSDERSAA